MADFISKLTIALSVLLAIFASSCDKEPEYAAPEPYATDWNAVADSATTAFIVNFWNGDKGFFNSTTDAEGESDYWPQAHAIDIVIDAYVRTGAPEYRNMFDKWYTGSRLRNYADPTSFYNDYYDDEAWFGLTLTRLYQVTGHRKYLDTAIELFKDIMKGWDTKTLDGGLLWFKNEPRWKNACINGPGATLAYRLYEITGDKAYAESGLMIYKWLRLNLMDTAAGSVYDHIETETGKQNGPVFSYNQGTAMAAAYYSYRYTGNDVYLNDARRIADYTVTSSKFIDSSTNVLLYEDGRIPDWNDGYLFRGIFLRYLADIIEEEDLGIEWRDKFYTVADASAQCLWQQGLTSKRQYRHMLFSSDWQHGVPVGRPGMLTPAIAATTAIETRARLYNILGK